MAGKRVKTFLENYIDRTRSYEEPKWKRGRIMVKTGPLSYEVDVGGRYLLVLPRESDDFGKQW